MARIITEFSLEDFIAESNRIEGIAGVRAGDMRAHEKLLSCVDKIAVQDVTDFVAGIEHDGMLRAENGMNVEVAGYRAPSGGPYVVETLAELLEGITARTITPFLAHTRYETLHPFMDGNGRSGRAIWLWMMGGIDRAPLGFLHHYYYQSLREWRGK